LIVNVNNMSDDLDDDILNSLEEYNWEVNDFEDLTQSDCYHNCSPIPDLDIKIEIDKVDLTKDEETHNKPEPSTSKALTSLRHTSRVRKTNQLMLFYLILVLHLSMIQIHLKTDLLSGSNQLH
jgi:hypothetical protein